MKATKTALFAMTIAVVLILISLAVRAFQPPIPLKILQAVKPGMSQQEVLSLMGDPTRKYPGGLSYEIRGTNYTTNEQWTYTKPLVFGYINILFDASNRVNYGHYETF